MKFREFLEQNYPQKIKLWSSKKDEILNLWKRLQPDTPIIMSSMQKKDGKVRSFGQDGIRISGDYNFCLGVLSRLKDLIPYEAENSKLRLIFKELDTRHNADPTQKSYVLYVNREDRGS